jgi:hypothetical protein
MSLPVLPVEIVAEIALNTPSGEVFLNFLLSCKKINGFIFPHIREVILRLVEIKRRNSRLPLYNYVKSKVETNNRVNLCKCLNWATVEDLFIRVRRCAKYIGAVCDNKGYLCDVDGKTPSDPEDWDYKCRDGSEGTYKLCDGCGICIILITPSRKEIDLIFNWMNLD